MAFDPTKKYEDALPAGTYVLAMVSFKRREGVSNGKPYKLRSCGFKVIYGQGKGRVFFDTVGMDESNNGAMAAVARLCGAIGQTDLFDLQDDEAFGQVFLGMPFKATVKTERKGNFTNTSIVKFEDMTRAENDAADAFFEDWKARAANASDFGFGANADKSDGQADDWG